MRLASIYLAFGLTLKGLGTFESFMLAYRERRSEGVKDDDDHSLKCTLNLPLGAHSP